MTFPIYTGRNRGVCVGMDINGVGECWKEWKLGSGEIYGDVPTKQKLQVWYFSLGVREDS